jgi:hypothetical protein
MPDRNAVVFTSHASKGLELSDNSSLLFAGSLDGRYEDGNFADTLLSASARYYRRQSERRLFYAGLAVDAGEKLDADRELMLGGDTGLRGYPLRYQGGQGRWLMTLEQRFFTDWYPFRLVHVGAAAFVDVGGTWGRDPLREQHPQGAERRRRRPAARQQPLGTRQRAAYRPGLPGRRRQSLKSMQVTVETKR